MADSKVSELLSTTSIGGSDLFYIVQSNVSKKITAANFFNSLGNVVISGNINVGGLPQLLSSPGIVQLTTPITHLSVDAVGGTINIPAGTSGQQKYVVLISSAGGSYAINNANIAGNANVIFDTVGDSATLLFTNNKWFVVGGTANVTY